VVRTFIASAAGLLGIALAVCVVGNAVAYSLQEGETFIAILKFMAFPLTAMVWPFVSPDGASAWPLAAGTSMIWAPIAILICGALTGLDD
jgi:hypothetical protein